ncbi:hypothetical protein ABPG72_012176 [Tetrahymena utriculariae]
MDLQNLEIFSNLIIQNVEKIEIDSINILSCLVNLVNQQSSFIQISSIKTLVVGNIFIDETLIYQLNKLIDVSNITQIQIKQLTINAGFFDPKDIQDQYQIQRAEKLSYNQGNSNDTILIQILGGKINIGQLTSNTKYSSITNICAEIILQINQIKINILNTRVDQNNQIFVLQASSLSQFFVDSVILISVEELKSQFYFLDINLFANKILKIGQLEIILPFHIQCLINIKIQNIFQDKSILRNYENQTLEINTINFSQISQFDSLSLSFLITGIRNVQIYEIKTQNTFSYFWDFQILLNENVYIKKLLIFQENTQLDKFEGSIEFSKIENLVFDEIILQNINHSFTSNIIVIDNSKILIKKIQISNFINQLISIFDITQSPSAVINNFIIENSLILNRIIQFFQVQNIKISNFQFNAPVKKEGQQYFTNYNNPAYLIYVNKTDLVTINNFQVDFNNNQFGLLWAYGLAQIIIEETQLKNAFAINQGGCLYLSTDNYQPNQTLITLRNSYFYNFSSTHFGGCIYGGQIVQVENSGFKYCSSYVGGALYISDQSTKIELDKIQFEKNKADLYGNNFSFYIQLILATKIYEYNPQFESTNLFLFELKDPINLIKGMNYIITVQFRIDGEFYPLKNQDVQSLNMYQYLNQNQNFQIDTDLDIKSPFLSYYLDAYQDLILFQIYLLISDIRYNLYQMFSYEQLTFCPENMEKVIVNQKQNLFLCKYCSYQQTIQIYQQPDGKPLSFCQSCNSQYFSVCYANFSQLKEGYWRKSYSLQNYEDSIGRASIKCMVTFPAANVATQKVTLQRSVLFLYHFYQAQEQSLLVALKAQRIISQHNISKK